MGSGVGRDQRTSRSIGASAKMDRQQLAAFTGEMLQIVLQILHIKTAGRHDLDPCSMHPTTVQIQVCRIVFPSRLITPFSTPTQTPRLAIWGSQRLPLRVRRRRLRDAMRPHGGSSIVAASNLPAPLTNGELLQVASLSDVPDSEALAAWLSERGLDTSDWGKENTKDVSKYWKAPWLKHAEAIGRL